MLHTFKVSFSYQNCKTCDNWKWQHFDDISVSPITDAMSNWPTQANIFILSMKKHGNLYYGFGCVVFCCCFDVHHVRLQVAYMAVGRCFPMFGSSVQWPSVPSVDATAGLGFRARTRCPKLSFPWLSRPSRVTNQPETQAAEAGDT